MKDIITIIIRLTVSCLLAATVIGVTFIFTSNAKKHNEHAKEQQVMLELLGYKGNVTVPDSISMHEIYRYIISGQNSQSIGYLVPAGDGEDDGFFFVNIDLNGKPLESKIVDMSEADSRDAEIRDIAVSSRIRICGRFC